MKRMTLSEKLHFHNENFVGSLQIHRLGRFTHGYDILLIGDLIQRCLMMSAQGIASSKEPIFEHIAKLHTAIDGKGTTLENVYGEVFFWWRNSGDDALVDRSMDSTNPHLNARISLLTLALNHPDKHDYFAVGITDTVAIARFIADGIDPELALSTIAGVR